MAGRTFVAVGQIDRGENGFHGVGEVIQDLSEEEAEHLLSSGSVLEVKGASAVAYAQSLVSKRDASTPPAREVSDEEKAIMEGDPRSAATLGAVINNTEGVASGQDRNPSAVAAELAVSRGEVGEPAETPAKQAHDAEQSGDTGSETPPPAPRTSSKKK